MPDEYPLANLVNEWISLIRKAEEVKHEMFGQYAREAMQFFDSSHNFMWQLEYAAAERGGFLSPDSIGVGFPMFRMTVNRVFELVAQFGPFIYHRNPSISVVPKLPPLMTPEELGYDLSNQEHQRIADYLMRRQEAERGDAKLRARLLQSYLNWVQQETDKKSHMRRAINEAIIKGMGCLWTELYRPPASTRMYPRSSFISCDDILKDPDARYREDVQWIARWCCHPINLVEEKYGYKPGQLRGRLQSTQSLVTADGRLDRLGRRAESHTYDLLGYWEIYSKNGIGQHLKTISRDASRQGVDLSAFGQYCYLALADGIPFPLNLPPWNMDPKNAEWPIPFWMDEGCNNGWPMTELAFFESPDSIWPISLVKPAIGELRFINWCMSYLADKVASTCTTYVATIKSAAEEIQQQVINQTGPFKLLKLPAHAGQDIRQAVSFLQPPNFPSDIWGMLAELGKSVEKKIGLTELHYGYSSAQYRSAEEARVKSEAISVRPDEMASQVENFASWVAMKEVECAVWSLTREDFIPVLGEVGANVFQNKILERPFENIVREFTYRVEAGSARKPNKASKSYQLTQIGSVVMPMFQMLAQRGEVGPWNAYVRDVAEALDLEDPESYMVSAPQPPQGAEAEQPDASAAAEMQMKLAAANAALEAKRAEIEAKLASAQIEQQSRMSEIAAREAKTDADLRRIERRIELDARKRYLDEELATLRARQEMDLKAEKARLDMELARQKAVQQMSQSAAESEQQAAESLSKSEAEAAIRRAKAQLEEDIKAATASLDMRLKELKALHEMRLRSEKQSAEQEPQAHHQEPQAHHQEPKAHHQEPQAHQDEPADAQGPDVVHEEVVIAPGAEASEADADQESIIEKLREQGLRDLSDGLNQEG